MAPTISTNLKDDAGLDEVIDWLERQMNIHGRGGNIATNAPLAAR